MEVRIYRPPTEAAPVYLPLGVTYDAESASYNESFYSFGTFELRLPGGSYGSEKFAKYLYMLIDRSFWGMINEVERTIDSGGDKITVSGICLDGLTSSRCTVPPSFTYEEVGGTAGYDVADGSTETCMKHFVESNFFQESSPTRSIPGFVIAPDLQRGIEDDRYMTRFDMLSTVLEELGSAAKVGYSIKPDLEAGSLVFDCAVGVDRTAGQSDNPRVVFTIERRNVASMRHLDSDRNMKNLFYASLSGSEFADDVYTAMITRDPDSDYPSGIHRWEQQLDIGAAHPDPGRELEELKRLALARAESYETANTLTVEVIDAAQRYGVDYNLGDIVTVENREWGLSMDTQLTAMAVDGSEGGAKHTATFGNAPVNVINRLKRAIRGG